MQMNIEWLAYLNKYFVDFIDVTFTFQTDLLKLLLIYLKSKQTYLCYL